MARLAETSNRCLNHFPAPPAAAAPTATTPLTMKNPRRSIAALRSVVPRFWRSRSDQLSVAADVVPPAAAGCTSRRSSRTSRAMIPATAPTIGETTSIAWPVGRRTAITAADDAERAEADDADPSAAARPTAPITNPSSPITTSMPTRSATLSFVPNCSTAKFFNQIGVRSMNSAPTASRGDLRIAEQPGEEVADAERERGRDKPRECGAQASRPGARLAPRRDGRCGHTGSTARASNRMSPTAIRCRVYARRFGRFGRCVVRRFGGALRTAPDQEAGDGGDRNHDDDDADDRAGCCCRRSRRPGSPR